MPTYEPCDKCGLDKPMGFECPWCAIKTLEAERDTMMRSLVHIRSNAEGMLRAQAAIGTPEDAPEAINALWVYTEANSGLGSVESVPKSIL